jgi:putative aldouronate transport system substrate-binding protein
MLLACGGGNDTTTTTTKAPETTTTKGNDEQPADTTTTAKPEDDTTTTASEAPVDDGRPDETYKAKFVLFVPKDNWPHEQQVKDKIKEITTRDLNVECEILPMTFATVNSQVPLMLAAGEQLDVINCSYPVDYYEQAYVIDLLDYKQYVQEAIDWIGEDEIMASLRGGHLIGLPWQLERTHRYGMAMRTDILEACGYDPATINGPIDDAYDKATEIFAAVKEKYPDMTVMGGPYNSGPPCNTQHTDAMSDGYGVLDNYGATFDVVNYYETEYFKMSCDYMKKWFDAGYIQKDLATSQDSYESLVKAGGTFGGCCPMKPDSYAEKGDQCNYPMTIYYFREDFMTAYTGTGYAVSGTSKDYVQAARLLNYMFVSREFNDTINWGVEGLDWVEDESDPTRNTAKYPDGMDASNAGWHNSYGWAYPNERIAHVWVGNEPNMYTELYPNAEKASHRTIAWGFIFDNADYLDTIGALNNIRDEYIYVLASGSAPDVEASMAEMNQRLYGSGLQDVMDAKTEQLAAWRAENGK